MADDDDDVAIDAGMEPEHSIEDHNAGRSAISAGDDGDDDEPAIGMGPSGDVPKRGRVISEATRQAFLKASQSIKQQLSDDTDGEFGEYDEGTHEPAPAAPVATASKQAAQVDSPTGAAAEPAPAPSLAPEVRAKLEQVQSRMAELDERESKLAEREAASDMSRVRNAYYETGAKAVSDLVRSFIGKDATDEDLRSEIADLITDLSGSVLGVEIPSEIRNKIEAKKAHRSIRALKDSMIESETQKTKRQEQEQRVAVRARAIGALDKELIRTDAPHAKAFPYLIAEDNPGEIIMEICEAQLRKDGTQMTWEDAAKRANDYLSKKASAYFDKRKHLFTAAPVQSGARAAGEGERPQGDPQGIRRSHTLTNAQASAATVPTPTPAPVGKDGKWSREAHRAATRQKFRKAFVASSDE